MAAVRLAAAAAHFGRDLEQCISRVTTIIRHARIAGASVLVLPHAALGGYLADLRHLEAEDLPPALDESSPWFARVRAEAGDLAVCLGYTESHDGLLYNSAVCLSGDGVLGRHRKVHLPPGEALIYSRGETFTAFDTPAGRVGMLIDYDKTFPEGARALADDGASMLAVLSAWPASVTRRASSLVHDRQTRLFDLYDAARAAENQVVVISANQTGSMGGLRFLGHAKVVGPGGEVLARTSAAAGLAVAELDVEAQLSQARAVQHHLRERQPAAYQQAPDPVATRIPSPTQGASS